MSKRFGNVINPDDVVVAQGADAFRLYEMFMGPFSNTTAWSTSSIAGTARFVERVWSTQHLVTNAAVPELATVLAQTVKKVGEDIESFKFNTAVSQLMIFLNAVEEAGSIGEAQWSAFVRVLAPFAPHLCEELWERSENVGSVHKAPWPEYDETALKIALARVVVQINGKRRAEVMLSPDATQAEALEAALAQNSVAKQLARDPSTRTVYVPGKIINIVVQGP